MVKAAGSYFWREFWPPVKPEAVIPSVQHCIVAVVPSAPCSIVCTVFAEFLRTHLVSLFALADRKLRANFAA